MKRTPLIVGHRGASRDAPENTLASFLLAFAQGADGIEADFRLSRDGQVVCIHDATTARTAGVDVTVADATLNELKLLDVGSWFGPQWAGEKIPTLDEVLAIVPPGKSIFIEVKYGAEIMPQLKKALMRPQVSLENIRLLTFDAGLAGELAVMLPGARVCLNVAYTRADTAAAWTPSRNSILDMIADNGAIGLSSEAHPTVDAAFVTTLRCMGKELFIWTVDSMSAANRYRRLGVDALMTNRPGYLVAGLFPLPE